MVVRPSGPRGAKLEKSFHQAWLLGKLLAGKPHTGNRLAFSEVIDFCDSLSSFLCVCVRVVGGGFSPGKPKDDRISSSQQLGGDGGRFSECWLVPCRGGTLLGLPLG